MDFTTTTGSPVSQEFLSPMSFETAPNDKIETFQDNLRVAQPVTVKLPQTGIVLMILMDNRGPTAWVAIDSKGHQRRSSSQGILKGSCLCTSLFYVLNKTKPSQ